MIVQVEVDVATARPVGVHDQVWVWVSADSSAEARLIACEMAASFPEVVMPVGARIIDWKD